jgi:dolichol kinase
MSRLVAVLVLGVGDPAATLIGKRFGRRFKLYRQKSLAGSLAFVAASFITVATFLFWRRPLLSAAYKVLMALCAGIVGAYFDTTFVILVGVVINILFQIFSPRASPLDLSLVFVRSICIMFWRPLTFAHQISLGSVAELFSDDTYDDNLTVPVSVALALSLTFQ